MSSESIETVVIGGGQAGLAVGYHLRRLGRPFVILDAATRVGDAWRERWDSLRLFTPAHVSALDGMRFPGPGGVFPTKDQMADYLEAYARRFDLPVRSGVTVDRLSRDGARFEVSAGDLKLEADNVVVAMSSLQSPRVPSFASELRPGIVQVHSHHYRNPDQLTDGGVLVVGAANSGADIALEVARGHPTWLAGKQVGAIPWRIESFVHRRLVIQAMRFVGHHLLTIKTPIGRKARPMIKSKGAPLVRVKPSDLVAAGIQRVDRITGVRDGLPMAEDGRTFDVANVIWCTGFRPGFSWIDLPVMGDFGEPEHEGGVVISEPGLYFVGLLFLYSMTSETVTGVSRDARRIVDHIVRASRQPVVAAPSPNLTYAAKGEINA